MEFKKRISKSMSTHSSMRHLPLGLGIIVCLLLFIQVVVSNRLATSGYEISQIETEVETVTQENEILKEHIASASALTTLKTEAEKLGFNKSITPAFLSRILPVALGGH